MDALKFPPVLPEEKNSPPSAYNATGRAPLVPSPRTRLSFLLFPAYILSENTPGCALKWTRAELRGLAGDNNGADEGPKLPCGFFKKKEEEKKEATIASSPLLFRGGGNSGARRRKIRRLDDLKKRRARTHATATGISITFPIKICYLLIPDCPFRYFLTFHFLSTQP